MAMQQILTVKRYIGEPGEFQTILVCLDGSLDVMGMIVQHDSDEVHAFRKVLSPRLVDM